MTRLTTEQISSLEGQALVDAVAERVMGWTFDLMTHSWRYPNGMLAARRTDEWRPDWDHNDAAQVMERIVELELFDAYAFALLPNWGYEDAIIGFDEIRIVATASPEARCLAALMAVEGER